ncbi:MAG: tetratricopeptide repeat protein [Pirellulales bacterium]
MGSDPYETQSFESARGQADALCDRFEAAWKSGETPRIEHYLEGYEPQEDSLSVRDLLIQLVTIDLRRRWPAAPEETIDPVASTHHHEASDEESYIVPHLPDRPKLEHYVSRYTAIVAGLREELAQRRSLWDPVFEVAAPFDNREQIFPSELIAVDDSRLKVQVTGSEKPVARILTREACGGHVEIEAEFDPSWTAAASLGVLLGATSTGGYSFVLREEETEPSSVAENSAVLTESPLQTESTNRALILEISRDGTPLQRVALAASAVGEGPLRLRARREGYRLAFWVNDRAPLEFEDIFSLSPAKPGVFGVVWPSGVGLVRLAAARRATPERASPLEQGDELFGRGQFAEAMSRYQESVQKVRDPEFRQEAQFKSALCLMNHQRQEEAAELFGQLTGQGGNRWPLLAGCRLWLLRLRQNKPQEAETIFESLSARFTFDQLAARIPSEVRQGILKSYSDQIYKAESFLAVHPNRVRDMARVVAVEELLSLDGRAHPDTQFQLGRAYELTGDFERAMEIYKQGAEETARVNSPRLYVRMLCLCGEPQRALDEINRYLEYPRFEPNSVHLLRSRARVHAALEDWNSARADLEEVLRATPPAETIDVQLHTETYLMFGFVHEHLRGKAAAEETWRTLLADLRPYVRNLKVGISTPTDFLIMASLADELTAEDVDNFMASFSSRGQAGSLLPFGRTLIGDDSLTAVFRQMWRTPRGRRWAEKIAFRHTPVGEHVQIPIQLAISQYFRQRAFGSNLSDEQDALVWDLCEEVHAVVFETGQLAQPQMVQLALAWKGQTNWLGWASVAPTLKPSLRGPIAYVLAHRYLQMKKPDDAATFLRTGLEDAPEDSALARLAQTDLDLLEANQGRLLVENDFLESLRLSVKLDDKEVATLDIDTDQTADQTLDLPVGNYDLQLVDPPDDVSLSANRIDVTPAGRHSLRVEWLWKPGAAEQPLPGLVPRPASLPGVGRWQIETVEPRGEVRGVSFSPSDDLVACANGFAVRVYDTHTQRLVRLFLGHTGQCYSTSFSPDGRWLASSSADGTVRLWNMAKGLPGPVLQGHTGDVQCVAWRPDGQQLASAGGYEVRLWNADGTLDRVVEEQPGYAYSICCWSPDGRRLASTAGNHRTVRVWTSEGRSVATLKHTKTPRNVAWSPDGKWLAVATVIPSRILLWDTSDWGSSPVVLEERVSSGNILGWSPDSRKLLFHGPDNKVSVWNLETRSSDVLGNCSWPTSVAWHPRSSQVVLGDTGLVRFWDTEDAEVHWQMGNPTGLVTSVAWSPNGRQIVSGGCDHAVRLWDAASGSPLNVLRGHTNLVLSVAWDPYGRQIASGSQDHTIRLWNASDGSPQGVLDAHSSGVRSVAWSPDGEHLASGGGDKKVIVWNPAEGKPDVVLDADDRVTGVCWSPDASWIVAGMEGGSARLWQADGTPARVLECDNRALAFSPDGVWLSAGHREEKSAIQLLDTEDWQPGPVLNSTTYHRISPVAWCPDSNHLAVSHSSGFQIKVCAIDGGPGLLLTGHADCVVTLAVSPTGTPRLVSGANDNTLRLWDTETGEPIWVALVLPDGKSAAFTSGGELISTEDDEVDAQIVYVVEQPDGEQKLLSPVEFRKMIDNEPGTATPSGGRSGAKSPVEAPPGPG